MQNKPKVKYAKINLNTFIAMRYEEMDNWLFRQTKPIQTQFKPNLTQFKPNLSQNKAKTKPICRKAKNESFCVDKGLYNDINNVTREIYHPKGCQFKPNLSKGQKCWNLP